MPKRGRMTAGSSAVLVARPTPVGMLARGAWQFVILGLPHGAFRVVAQGWRWKVRRGRSLDGGAPARVAGPVLPTFLRLAVSMGGAAPAAAPCAPPVSRIGTGPRLVLPARFAPSRQPRQF